MTEIEKITEFAKRKNVTFSIKHETIGVHKLELTTFVFGYGPNHSSIINVSFHNSEYDHRLEEKTLAESVIWVLSEQHAEIKSIEEFDKDMEFLKTLKEN